MTTGAGVAIRPLEAADAPACFEVVRSLLDHFGDRDGQRECAEAVRTAAGLVAVRDGQVVGFLTVVHNGHPGLLPLGRVGPGPGAARPLAGQQGAAPGHAAGGP